MKLAILSDIHANLEALTEVLAQASRLGVDGYLVAGDIVGYGADPVACVEMVQDLNAAVVAGNHDWAAVGKLSVDTFNAAAAEAVRWTSWRLEASHKAYLEGLPLSHRTDDLLMVHATPTDPASWDYLVSVSDLREAARHVGGRLCVVGHSHVPFVYRVTDNEECVWQQPGDYPLEPEATYLVNVGSVGQPRDGDPRACFAVLDTDTQVLTLVRVPYPVEQAQEKILKAGLPRFLARRLAWGS